MKRLSISAVIPVYAGKDYLSALIEKIDQVRKRWAESDAPIELIEAVFVNDSSTDGSLELLHSLQESNPWVRVINLSRNFGQHQATVAGILHTSGDWVFTLDEDLQHDPVFFEPLLRCAVEAGADITYANPDANVHENIFRDWASKGYKWFVSSVTGNRHIQNFNSFRLIRGSIARASASVCSHGTYFDIALCWFTDRVYSKTLPLKDIRLIERGKSGYTVRKLFSHARRLLISSQAKVVRLGAALGLMAIVLASVLGAITLLDKVFSPESIAVQGWTSLFLTQLFFSGLIVLLVGVALEYISVILLHIQGKPTFFVVDRISDKILTDYYQEFIAE